MTPGEEARDGVRDGVGEAGHDIVPGARIVRVHAW